MAAADRTLAATDIEASIDLALSYLRSHIRVAQPGRAGWYHFLDDESPGVTASAVGLFCFDVSQRYYERAAEVYAYLVDEQTLQPDGPNRGGWSIRTTEGFAVVEATAWVVRALSRPATAVRGATVALESGTRWLEDAQNDDFGWGSYKGQTSRTFTTSLVLLALTEAGGQQGSITSAARWLVDTQDSTAPAWGPTPGTEPTVLHTSMALAALARIQGALSATSRSATIEWIAENLNPLSDTERASVVEDYDVPFTVGGVAHTFQNSLAHFALPIAIVTLAETGANLLDSRIFSGVQGMIARQRSEGYWDLPRSPNRASIWAIWPFVAALASVRRVLLSTSTSRVELMFAGAAISQTSVASGSVTRRLILKNAVFDFLRRNKLLVSLWTVTAAAVGTALGLLASGTLSLGEFFATLVIPALLLIFHLLWERRKEAPR